MRIVYAISLCTQEAFYFYHLHHQREMKHPPLIFQDNVSNIVFPQYGQRARTKTEKTLCCREKREGKTHRKGGIYFKN